MKKLLLFATIILSGIAAQAQTTPELTKTAWLTNNTGKAMQAYPNPAVSEVTIQHVSSPERAILSIISTDGRILLQRTIVANTLQTQLHIGMLSKGMYIVKFEGAKGDVRTLRLVKNQ
ncbi:MAG: T9SS type A sorting domain-containing protein [Ferruginibacter sp.]|nr:T9SS type A sorting domain-containing protein [Chitinophagaceae bacterium]